ncbi:23202_t:CDS:2, partial [Rhizophagus irregularis]
CFSNSNLNSLMQNLIPNDNDISNLLFNNEMEYNDSNFVNEKNEYENQIVDSETKQYDNSNKIHNFSKKSRPYFSNFTHFLLFMWITKHQIGCEAYQDFSNIIKHSDFNISDVLYFIITIKKYQNSLPLIPFNGYDIELNDRNIFSTLKLTHQLMDMKKPDNYDYCIDEIVYKSNNKWNTQLVDLCHKHPIEYIPIRDGS